MLDMECIYTTESRINQLPKIEFSTSSRTRIIKVMNQTAKKAFSDRLVSVMLEKGYVAKRSASSGVDFLLLAKQANVSKEMARRYTIGKAIPGPDTMKVIAAWLGVNLSWLRDGIGAAIEVEDQIKVLASRIAKLPQPKINALLALFEETSDINEPTAHEKSIDTFEVHLENTPLGPEGDKVYAQQSLNKYKFEKKDTKPPFKRIKKKG